MAKVLVIDDEDIYCEYLSGILSRHGHEVRTATNVADAVRINADFSPDVLIADWMLAEDCNGLMAAQALQSTNPRLQTIITTGYSAARSESEAAAGNIFRFIEKPFGLQDIVNAVRDAVVARG